MKKTTSGSKKVWYVDSGALNHMTSHEEWFSFLEKLEQPRFVKTGDDTPHPIEHVREVHLRHVGKKRQVDERITCSKNYQEPGVGQTDR